MISDFAGPCAPLRAVTLEIRANRRKTKPHAHPVLVLVGWRRRPLPAIVECFEIRAKYAPDRRDLDLLDQDDASSGVGLAALGGSIHALELRDFIHLVLEEVGYGLG